jgi:gamma-glutamyl-gamma-aminobutyrate hydrolase PuuD
MEMMRSTPQRTKYSVYHLYTRRRMERDQGRIMGRSIKEFKRHEQELGEREIWVNGKHHQAVKEPAPGLIVSARATDGVMEALEDPSRSFLLGVQWHPEGTWREDPYSKKLFRALVEAAYATT